jgi:RNA polymerase sigma factor (sigma-70 family)
LALDIEAHYQQYGPMVLRRCRRLMRNEEKALDAMQDVFVQVLRNEARLTETAPAALLLRIATNLCLNKLRSEKRHPEDQDDEIVLRLANTKDEDIESRSLSRTLLTKIFGREPESTKTIAIMHYVDRMTLEEVAQEVGMSVSGVRKRLRVLQERVKSLPALSPPR